MIILEILILLSILSFWFAVYYGIYTMYKLYSELRQEIEDFEPEKDNKIIRIDKIDSKIPIYEIVYMTLSKGQKKKILISEESEFFAPIKSGELKIGDLF